jgi:hypothetical protein
MKCPDSFLIHLTHLTLTEELETNRVPLKNEKGVNDSFKHQDGNINAENPNRRV